jgi:hypothetical protein
VGDNGVEKVFEDGAKLFQLSRKLGVATFGMAGFAGRSIGSFLYEFAGTHPELKDKPLEETVENLRAFFLSQYISFAELTYGKPFDEITDINWNSFGLIVVGIRRDHSVGGLGDQASRATVTPVGPLRSQPTTGPPGPDVPLSHWESGLKPSSA